MNEPGIQSQPPAPQAPLLRCVCGADIPISSEAKLECPSCKRVHPNPRTYKSGDTVYGVTISPQTNSNPKGPLASILNLTKDRKSESRISDLLRQGTSFPKEDPFSQETVSIPPMTASTVHGETLSEEAAADCEQLPDDDLVGNTIDHFELLEVIGKGGMGTVYRALDRSLERFVAIKVIRRKEFCSHPERLQEFVHEARAQARINHPGIATIYYIGSYMGDGGELPYFAMELLSSVSLDRELEKGRMSFNQVIRLGLQLVRALSEAEECGVVHRDIKPANIVMNETGSVKITDFGLSKTVSHEEEQQARAGVQITGSRAITGTPYYMSPEQARGEETDFRSDIYSLGATLYHLAFGQPPFGGDNFMSVVSKHLADPLKFPSSVPSDIPFEFRDLLLKMMAKDPKDRFQTYQDLEDALKGLLPENRVIGSMFRRFFATAADYFLLFFAMICTIGVLSFVQQLTESPLWGNDTIALVGLSTFFGGMFLFQYLFEGTPGKIFGHLRTAHIKGRKIGFWTHLGRYMIQYNVITMMIVYSLLPYLHADITSSSIQPLFLPSFFGCCIFSLFDYLWAFTNRNRRTLHDFIFRTWVLVRRDIT